MVAGTVAVIVHHVKDVALSSLVRDRASVVWTVDIKVVVDANVDVVITPVKPGREREWGCEHMQIQYRVFMYNNGKVVLLFY